MRNVPTMVVSLGLIISASSALADNTATTTDRSMTTTTTETTTETKSDAGITSRVKSALTTDKASKASQINVETDNGVVQLSGFVDSEAMKSAAVATARNVEGVKSVENELLIRASNRTTGETVDDTVIAAKLKTQLVGKTGLGTGTDVNVEVNSGIVELSGFVTTSEEKMRAGEIANNIGGVKSVKNNIALKAKT